MVTIMKKLLNRDEKDRIKEGFKDNVIYDTLKKAYKDKETKMDKLRFSPEEIFINSFICFDSMIKDSERISDITSCLWDDIYSDLCDDANEKGRDYEKHELELATSCIFCVVIVLMECTEDWTYTQYTDNLMRMLGNQCENIDDVFSPLHKRISDDFMKYVKKYLKREKYISDMFDKARVISDPVRKLVKATDRDIFKKKVHKRLEFMKGLQSKESAQRIMTEIDYNNMIKAVDYLIENNVVDTQINNIHFNMPIRHFSYTFYLVYKKDCQKKIQKQLWIDFLVNTFPQMVNGKDSLPKHFSDRPNNYYIRKK